MSTSGLLRQLAQKDVAKEQIAKRVIEQPALLAELFHGLNAAPASVKYGAAKVLRIVSQQAPALLYPQFDRFVELLRGDHTFLRWDATHIIGNLAAVDADDRFEKVFAEYFAAIPGPHLIPAANTIGAAATIAVAKPELADRIAQEILKAEKATYATAECRNVAVGHAIDAFDRFFYLLRDREPVVRFVKRQLKNSRPATRKKAEAFLQKRARLRLPDPWKLS